MTKHEYTMIPTSATTSHTDHVDHVDQQASASGGAAAAAGPSAHEPSQVRQLGARALFLEPEEAELVSNGGSVRLNPQRLDIIAAQAEAAAVLGDAILGEADALHASLSPSEQRLALDTHDVLSRMVKASGHHDRTQAARDGSVGANRALTNLVAEHLNRLEANWPPHLAPMDEHERMAETFSCASRYLLRNESDSTLGRCAGNLISTGVRSGVSTYIGTGVRNAIGFHLQRMLNGLRAANGGILPEAAASWLNAGGVVFLGIPAALQIFGVVRDAYYGQGSRESQTNRMAQGAMSLALTGAASYAGHWETLVAINATVLVYSIARATGAIGTKYESNQGPQSQASLGGATTAYAGIQATFSMIQDAAGWNTSVSDSRIRLQDSAGVSRTPAEITGTAHNWGGNAGHSGLNMSIEVFDDLVTGAISRAFLTTKKRAEYKALGPEKQAQVVAAGIHAYVNTCRADVGNSLSQAGRKSAFVSGMQSFQNSELEGLRMSLSRTPPAPGAVQARAQRAVEDLAALGYVFDRDAPAGSTAEQNNRVVAAFVAQSITALHLQQPLARPGGGSWATLGTRTLNQFVNVEAQRMHLFHAVFAGLYAVPGLPANPDRNPAVDSAASAAELAAYEVFAYPIYVAALEGRVPPPAEVESQRALQAEIDAIAQGRGRPAAAAQPAAQEAGPNGLRRRAVPGGDVSRADAELAEVRVDPPPVAPGQPGHLDTHF